MEKTPFKTNPTKKIKNPIVDALYEYIEDFNLKFAETKETFKPAKLTTSDRKEEIVKNFFSSFFPTGYEFSRGEIFDYNNISNSIDCVIKTPDHPKLSTPLRPEIILAEGVYAAIEVKPDISTLTDRSEFNRALKQCTSVKKLKRDIKNEGFERVDPNKDYKRIPFILFSKKSNDIEKTLDYIISKIENKKIQLFEIPDIIFSLDGWMIYHTTNINSSLFKEEFIKRGVPSNSKSTFMLFKGETKDLLCMLLIILFFFPNIGIKVNESIIEKYLLDLYYNGAIRYSSAVTYDKE